MCHSCTIELKEAVRALRIAVVGVSHNACFIQVALTGVSICNIPSPVATISHHMYMHTELQLFKFGCI